jgi:hypothetical protein
VFDDDPTCLTVAPAIQRCLGAKWPISGVFPTYFFNIPTQGGNGLRDTRGATLC